MLIMYQVDSFDFPVEEARPEFSNSIEPSLTRPNRIWLIAGQSTEFYKKKRTNYSRKVHEIESGFWALLLGAIVLIGMKYEL